MIRIGPRTIIIYLILIWNKAKTLFMQLMRTYVWNLTDLFDDNRLESLTATTFYYMMVKCKIVVHNWTRDQAFGQNFSHGKWKSFRPKNLDSPEWQGDFLGGRKWRSVSMSESTRSPPVTEAKSRVKIWATILINRRWIRLRYFWQ